MLASSQQSAARSAHIDDQPVSCIISQVGSATSLIPPSSMSDVQGIFIDDGNDEYVSYFPPSGWKDMRGTNYQNFTYHMAIAPGAYCTFTFTGVSVAYYSDKNFDHGNFTVTIDSNYVFNGSSYAPNFILQQPLFKQTVAPGQHVLKITNAMNSSISGVDYFLYIPIPGSPTSAQTSSTVNPDSTEGTTITASSSGSQSHSQTALSQEPYDSAARVPNVRLIAGIAGGVLAVVAAIVMVFFFLRHRKAQSDLETRVLRQEGVVQTSIARHEPAPPPYPVQQPVSISDTRSRKTRLLGGYPVQAI